MSAAPKNKTPYIMAGILLLALAVRLPLLGHVTLDYQDFLSQWVEFFRQNGGFSALKDPVSNYNVP